MTAILFRWQPFHGRRLDRQFAAGLLTLAFCLAPVALVQAQEDPEPDDPGVVGDSRQPAANTLENYIAALRVFQKQTVEASGMNITTSVIPDLYLYGLAKALEEAKKSGLTPEKLAERMRAEHKKLKRVKELRMLIRVEIAPVDSMNHLFLQKKTESHVKVDGEGKVFDATEGSPSPRFEKWQIIQGASMKDFNLARFDSLQFDVEVRKKGTEVCRLQIVEILRYLDTPKKSEYEAKGINVGARQISLHTIRDMAVDPISVELAPATWKAPTPPAELEEWRAKLEVEKASSAAGSSRSG